MYAHSFPPAVGACLPSQLPGVIHYRIADLGGDRGGRLGAGGKGVAFKVWVVGGANDGEARVIKFPKIDLDSHTLQQNRDWVERINRALETETSASQELHEVHGVTPIIELVGGLWQFDQYPGHPQLNLFYTVYEFIEGNTLYEWTKAGSPSPDGKFHGLPDANGWLDFSRRLMTKLEEIHCRRVVHGDIWPDNIMVSPDGKLLTVIDFGEAWSMSHQLESTSGQKYHPYLAPERYSDMPEGSRWYSSADIYSMGGVLYYLATGEDPISPFEGDTRTHRRGRSLKRDIISTIKNCNRVLYEQQPGIADVILMCMRPKVPDRATTASEVVETIDTLRGAYPADGLRTVIDELDNLNATLRELESQPLAQNPIIQRVVLRSIRALHHDARTLRSRVFVIDGSRETHVNGLLACVGALGAGDEVRAVSSSRFWRKENFGPYGRLTSMLIAAAVRGAKVDWQILLDPTHAVEDQQVLQYQRLTVEEYMFCAGLDLVAYEESGLFHVGFHIITLEQLKQVRRERGTGVLLRKGADWTLAAVDYSDESGALSAVRLWHDPSRLREMQDRHAEWAKRAKSILTYVPPSP